MSDSKLLTVLVVVFIITSLFSIGLIYMSAKSLFSVISGYATSTGEANLTVETVVAINFTTSAINWGSGRVNSGSTSASLTTLETGNVSNGNWTLQTAGGLRIQNIGNVNVTLNLSGTKTAATMIGGTAPDYLWAFSNVEAQSCLNSTGGPESLVSDSPPSLQEDFANVYTVTTSVCGRFRFRDSNDSLRIDFYLTVPSDSFTGALGDTITATAFATS